MTDIECSLCGGTGEVINRPTRLISATYKASNREATGGRGVRMKQDIGLPCILPKNPSGSTQTWIIRG